LIGYYQVLAEYFHIEHAGLTITQFAQKMAHLDYIRKEEAKKNPFR
jgi:hypothetical protein